MYKLQDIRFFKENKDACDQKYPYERADKLTKTIRKLGLNDKVCCVNMYSIVTAANVMLYCER